MQRLTTFARNVLDSQIAKFAKCAGIEIYCTYNYYCFTLTAWEIYHLKTANFLIWLDVLRRPPRGSDYLMTLDPGNENLKRRHFSKVTFHRSQPTSYTTHNLPNLYPGFNLQNP